MPEAVVAPDPFQRVYQQLLTVRQSKTVELRPNPMLRPEITGFDGQPQPFRLRYYQVQGIFHLLMVSRMVLGDGTGLGKCVTGGTLLSMSDGQLPIEGLKPTGVLGEGFYPPVRPVSVWTGSRMAPVRSFYWGGKKPTLKVTTRNGFEVEGSLRHPLYVRTVNGEGFVRLPDLKVGDSLCIDRNPSPFPTEGPSLPFNPGALSRNAKKYRYPKRLTPELATLLGYVVAEAHCTTHTTVVTQHLELNPEPHREIRVLFKDIFGWEGNSGNAGRDKSIGVSSIGIREFLRSCGVGEELSAKKEVPWCVLRGSKEEVRNFLSALIEAECSVECGGIEFSSASEQLVRQVQQLLLRFGVVSTRSPKRVKGREHIYWRLTFFGDDARVFQTEIGLRSKRKIQLLEKGLSKSSNPNKDLIPHATREVGALKERILLATTRRGANEHRKGSGIKQFGESFQSTLKHILNGYRDPSYQWLTKLLQIAHTVGLSDTQEYRQVSLLVQRHFYYDPIVRVESGEAEVMDLEIDDLDHCFVGNGFVNHNTAEALAALCYLWERDPNYKVIVVCPKSAIQQWSSEVYRFLLGAKTFVISGSFERRKAIYSAWAAHTGPSLLVLNYHLLVRDWDQGIKKEPPPPGAKKGTQAVAGRGFLDSLTIKLPKLTVILDEVTACKNPATKTHQTCKFLSQRAKRVWGLTATLLKNNLMEGFGIYKVIRPETFTTKTAFLNTYCITEFQRIKGGGKIPIVVGYKNLAQFRKTIDPFFYGRPKHAVSEELPALTTREILCELSPAEHRKYSEALQGILEMGDGGFRDYQDTKHLTSLIYAQEACNSLALLGYNEGDSIEGEKFSGRSSKEAALVDLLTEEFDGEKVIVYTRFEKLVGRLQKILAHEGVQSVCITGKVSDRERKKAQDKFQDLNSKVKVIFITNAGSEAINLQAASAMVFFDSPWSWGDYVQLLGRMIRIGSPHQRVLAVHLVAERPGKKRETIDHKVVKKLRSKKSVIDQIIGEAAVGALTFDRDETDLRELMRSLREDAREMTPGV
jgi:intein/homing endonuclease